MKKGFDDQELVKFVWGKKNFCYKKVVSPGNNHLVGDGGKNEEGVGERVGRTSKNEGVKSVFINV